VQHVPFETKQGSRGFPNVDCIDHKQAFHPGEMRQESKSLGSAIDQSAACWYPSISLQHVNRMHADAIVGMHKVAQSQHHC
jgi:hypothetical protein